MQRKPISIIKIELLFACVLITVNASSQGAQTIVTLKEIVQSAERHAPSLIADSAAILISESRLDATEFNWLPSFKLNYQVNIGTNNNVPGGYFSNGIVPGNSRVRATSSWDAILGNLGIASLNWEVYNFGSYSAERKAAQSEINIEKSKFTVSTLQTQQLVIGYYLELFRLRNLMTIQSRNIRANADIKKSIQSLAKNGIRPGVDTSIADAELSKSKLDYLNLENEFKKVQLQLSMLCNFPADSIQPDSSLTNKLMKTMLYAFPADEKLNEHPYIKLFQSLYNNSLDKEEAIKKSYNPAVSLQAAVWMRGSSLTVDDQYKALPEGLSIQRSNYLVGVGITYDLFDNKRKNLQTAIQQNYSKYILKRKAEEESKLSLDIQQANVELQTALRRLQEIPKQLNAAISAYKQKLSLYKNGLTDIVDLNIAVGALYRAERDASEADYLYCRAAFENIIAWNKLDFLLTILN